MAVQKHQLVSSISAVILLAPSETAAARRRPFSLSLSLLRPTFDFWKMLGALSFLLLTLLVVAHTITGDSQAIIAGKSSSKYQGWFDPRVNGGRLLDVRPRSNDVDMI